MQNKHINQPFVTIFILIYNNADGLRRTVNSVLEQTYGNAEVILSDDGSTNYDTNILEGYAEELRKRYKDVRININPENIGTVKHLNRVIQMAKGKYLFNCCSGDYFYSKDTISLLTRKFEISGKLILTTRRKDLYGTGQSKIRPLGFVNLAIKVCPNLLLNYMIQKKNLVSGCCTFCAKELFEKYGYYDGDYHLVEDYPYYVMLLQKKVKFGATSQISIIHEIGGVSTGKVHPSIYKDIELMRLKLLSNTDGLSKKTIELLKKCQNEK